MDPTIYYCYLQGKTGNEKLPTITYPSVSAFDLPITNVFQPKINEYRSVIRSSYLESEESLIFANADSVFNFSQRSGGFISPQEAKERVFYANSRFVEGLDEYLRFRFQGADGMIVLDNIDDFQFKLHRLEVPVMGYDEMDEQLYESFGHGIDIFLADISMSEINLCLNHLKKTGFGLFIMKDKQNLTSAVFQKLLRGFKKVSVFKPLVLTGTDDFVCICSEPRAQEIDMIDMFELTNFNQMVHETFEEQNKLNLFDRAKFNLSKATVVWNLH